MYKYLLLALVVLFSTGCTPMVSFNQDTNVVKLKLKGDTTKDIALKEPFYRTYVSSCLKEFIAAGLTGDSLDELVSFHQISIKNNCGWAIDPENIFTMVIKKVYETTEYTTSNKETIGNFIFKEVNLKSGTIHTIQIYSANDNLFILDANGKLTEDIRSSLR